MPETSAESDRQTPAAPAAPPWDGDGLRLHVLGSGSKGNCSVVESPGGLVLIDAGLSCRAVLARMEALGLDPSRAAAILVTHEHSDHIAGLRAVARRLKVPVFASRGTLESEAWRKAGGLAAEELRAGEAATVAGVRVLPFHVPHDAAECLGFRLERAGDAVAVCTDIGSLTEEAGERLADARVLALECNHDPAMLASYPGYPPVLKARIAGGSGHLSNDQAAAALPGLVTSRTRAVVGMHLSRHTNLPAAALRAMASGCPGRPAPGAPRVLVADQDEPLGWL